MLSDMTRRFTVVIERQSDGLLMGTVPCLPGCHTQGKSLYQLMERIREAIKLCLEVQDREAWSDLELVGILSIAL
jgi:predicted RNase H-like HicB family nuclease